MLPRSVCRRIGESGNRGIATRHLLLAKRRCLGAVAECVLASEIGNRTKSQFHAGDFRARRWDLNGRATGVSRGNQRMKGLSVPRKCLAVRGVSAPNWGRCDVGIRQGRLLIGSRIPSGGVVTEEPRPVHFVEFLGFESPVERHCFSPLKINKPFLSRFFLLKKKKPTDRYCECGGSQANKPRGIQPKEPHLIGKPGLCVLGNYRNRNPPDPCPIL